MKRMTTDRSSAGILPCASGATIAYDRSDGKKPGVMFLHGFRSDRTGGKAKAVEAFCQARGTAFVRYDARGHGDSSARFEDGCIGDWAEDAVAVLDALTDGPQVLVGSSMGGWLMLLTALRRPQRIAGLLGLAAAPDFTERLIYTALSPEDKRRLLIDGKIDLPGDCPGEDPAPITRHLIEEARNHLLLDAPVNLTCPIRLIHGMKDTAVPWQTALDLQAALISSDVSVTLRKSSGHRLSEPDDIAVILEQLEGLLQAVEG